MRNRSLEFFSTVKTEGAMLPPEILVRIAEMDSEMGGLTPDAYHLDKGEKINEAINRSWNRLLGVWTTFRKAQGLLPQEDPGTTLTRDKWLLKLFDEFGYGRLLPSKPMEVEEKIYPISHFWQHTPIHLIGFRAELDKSLAHHTGTYRYKPHSMVQTLLNHTEGHLWAFLSNGLQLRILRDNTSLVRQAYVEFDLEAMMDGGVFPDFKLLWLLCHQSRVEAARPEDCWLENWTRVTQVVGTRAREDLRNGVQRAIEALGAGFLAHPANGPLREDLRAGRLDKQDYYRELLRFVYQLIFLFVAEDRDLLAPPSTTPEAKGRYIRYYSTTRLRLLAGRKAGTRHDDLYRVTRLIIDSLGEGEGRKELGIPILNSSLFSPAATPSLKKSLIANMDYLEAIRALAITSDRHGRRRTDYKNLGSEELGSVYESLLELHPDVNIDAKTFNLKAAAGNERKTTGSYYTPTSLITCLLDTALDPVLDEAEGKENPEQAILNLKVCDPACGSGHFLLAAAHRMAGRVASIRAGGEEPPSDLYRRALRDVIGHCIYGVDINPMSVELCKVSLWMEALEPGRPLSFLDHRIVCGNSLLGTTPSLMAQGVPDEAFQPLEGDERTRVTSMKRQNRAERAGQGTLQFGVVFSTTTNRLGEALRELDRIDDAGIEGIREKEERHRAILESEDLARAKDSADAWCGAFVAPRKAGAPQITHDTFRCVSEGGLAALSSGHRESLRHLSEEYGFFHWHVVFPDVFRVPETGEPDVAPRGWSGGFDIVLGNPPWERLKLQEQEFFAERSPDVAKAPNAASRRRMIRDLAEKDPLLYREYEGALRKAEGESHIVRNAGTFPLCGRGDVNTYALFAEQFLNLLSTDGRAGIIVPTGIATDDSTKVYIDSVISEERLASFFSFENEEFIFKDVHHSYRFCMMTLLGSAKRQEATDYVFFARRVNNLDDERRHFTLSPSEIAHLNPNTKTCSIFRSKTDAELAKKIYNSVPVLVNEAKGADGNPWGITIRRIFDMAKPEVVSICAKESAEHLIQMYEGKMIHQYDHRWATYERNGEDIRDVTDSEKSTIAFSVLPRYWFPKEEVDSRLTEKGWTRGWMMGWRDITSAHVLRTVIAAVVPRSGTDFTYRVCYTQATPLKTVCLLANMNSLVLDFVCRMKLGGTHLSDYITMQLPVLSPAVFDEDAIAFIVPRVLELVYTAEDLRPFAVDLGYTGNPFPWNPERRALLRAELDAYYAKLYGLTRDELRYILDPADVYGEEFPSETFRVLKNNEMREFGEYRTRRLVLEAWYRLFEAEQV